MTQLTLHLLQSKSSDAYSFIPKEKISSLHIQKQKQKQNNLSCGSSFKRQWLSFLLKLENSELQKNQRRTKVQKNQTSKTVRCPWAHLLGPRRQQNFLRSQYLGLCLQNAHQNNQKELSSLQSLQRRDFLHVWSISQKDDKSPAA